jgi:hypothetical protein
MHSRSGIGSPFDLQIEGEIRRAHERERKRERTCIAILTGR